MINDSSEEFEETTKTVWLAKDDDLLHPSAKNIGTFCWTNVNRRKFRHLGGGRARWDDGKGWSETTFFLVKEKWASYRSDWQIVRHMHKFLNIEEHTWNYYCIDVRRLRILGTYEYEYTFPASVGVMYPSEAWHPHTVDMGMTFSHLGTTRELFRKYISLWWDSKGIQVFMWKAVIVWRCHRLMLSTQERSQISTPFSI